MNESENKLQEFLTILRQKKELKENLRTSSVLNMKPLVEQYLILDEQAMIRIATILDNIIRDKNNGK